MQYTIKKMADNLGALALEGEFFPDKLPKAYADLNELNIDQFPWDEGGYRPEAHARIGWNEKGLHVLMYAKEETIRTDVTETGGMVCCDSCIEFFFMPFPEADARYFNCESNAAAVMFLALGDQRHGRKIWNELPEGLQPVHSCHKGAWWAVSYTVPMSWISEHFDGKALASGQKMMCNCLKCDESIHPHFGMWSPVDISKWPKPDFHRPEYFSPMILE